MFGYTESEHTVLEQIILNDKNITTTIEIRNTIVDEEREALFESIRRNKPNIISVSGKYSYISFQQIDDDNRRIADYLFFYHELLNNGENFIKMTEEKLIIMNNDFKVLVSDYKDIDAKNLNYYKVITNHETGRLKNGSIVFY